MPSSRGSSQPQDQTHISYVSYTGRWALVHYHHLGSLSVSIPIYLLGSLSISMYLYLFVYTFLISTITYYYFSY